MAQERIELRFSPGNPTERALIDALSAQGDEYGAKSRFLKERLLRGYAAMVAEIDGFMAESAPMAALERRAQFVDAKHYRVLKVMLLDRLHGLAGNTQAVSIQVAPQVSPASSLQAVEPQSSDNAALPAEENRVEEPAEVPAEAPAVPAKKPHSWAGFSGIAGVKKDVKDSEG